MTETSYYRVQDASRDVTDLLDPGFQFSHPVNGSAVRVGVSVCDSLEDLALYLVCPQGAGVLSRIDNPVIVELKGVESDEAPLDPEFESLIIPTSVVATTPLSVEFQALMGKMAAFLDSFTDPNAD